MPGRRTRTALSVRVAQTYPARANCRSVKSDPSRRRASKVDFRRIGAKRCRTGRLALDRSFRVANSRPANTLKRPVQSRDVVQASFGGVGERGGRFDGVGDINLRVRGSPSVSTNSSSGINYYRLPVISGGDDQSSLMMTIQ